MKETSQAKNKRPRAAYPEEAAFLDLMRTTDMLSCGLIGVLKAEDLSATQYNLLRILRGAPEGLACGEIASRMITRDPDVTRLLDRLEKRSLISRRRETKDRRTVIARITPEGLTTSASWWPTPMPRSSRRRLRNSSLWMLSSPAWKVGRPFTTTPIYGISASTGPSPKPSGRPD
jgi:DNA-binding MarR family transcriptional regulator